MKAPRPVKVASNVSKHVIILLCALLFTGCMGEDFFTSDKYRPPGYRTTVKERFKQRPGHSPRWDERAYGHEQHSTVPRRSSTDAWQYTPHHNWSDAEQYSTLPRRNHTDDWQYTPPHSGSDAGRHSTVPRYSRQYTPPHSGSDADTKYYRSTSTTQAIRKKPSEISPELLKEGCLICCDGKVYKSHEVVQCNHCARFICRTCYKDICKACETPIIFDYGVPMSAGTYRLKKSCPFCRGSF